MASKLLAGRDDDVTASRLAPRVVEALEQLTRHLSPLMGELGVHALFARSMALSNAAFPWLPNTLHAPSPWAPLEAAMENQDSRAIVEGFGELLSAFVGLLERLIGKGLVAHLLHDVWPEVFPQAVKETT